MCYVTRLPQTYTPLTKPATLAVLAELDELKAQPRSKTRQDNLLKKHGLHGMKPGFFMDGPEGVLLLDEGYRLVTPDILHLLGRIIKNVYDCTEICVKFGQQRGQPSKWGEAGNRISKQWKFRPNDGRDISTFPDVCLLPACWLCHYVSVLESRFANLVSELSSRIGCQSGL